MNSKPFWQSKAFWTGVITVAVTAWNEVAVPQLGAPAIPGAIYIALAAFGVYSRAVATGPLTATPTK